MRPKWQDRSNCKDVGTDIFFHERYHHAVREAKTLCKACPVQQDCLEYAIVNECVGIWGGLTTVERRRHIRIEGRLKNGQQKQKQRYARRIVSGEMVERERPS
ncbi:MAG: WhiB family transcriptional regulator [Microbacteriaceae bacterium]|nr:WhiB family transcriptional regulator [Microbacteriaceae bacterium]NBS61991.1 WhiB family transcriptional regulator [Microbacteriaceae bacterium]